MAVNCPRWAAIVGIVFLSICLLSAGFALPVAATETAGDRLVQSTHPEQVVSSVSHWHAQRALDEVDTSTATQSSHATAADTSGERVQISPAGVTLAPGGTYTLAVTIPDAGTVEDATLDITLEGGNVSIEDATTLIGEGGFDAADRTDSTDDAQRVTYATDSLTIDDTVLLTVDVPDAATPADEIVLEAQYTANPGFGRSVDTSTGTTYDIAGTATTYESLAARADARAELAEQYRSAYDSIRTGGTGNFEAVFARSMVDATMTIGVETAKDYAAGPFETVDTAQSAQEAYDTTVGDGGTTSEVLGTLAPVIGSFGDFEEFYTDRVFSEDETNTSLAQLAKHQRAEADAWRNGDREAALEAIEKQQEAICIDDRTNARQFPSAIDRENTPCVHQASTNQFTTARSAPDGSDARQLTEFFSSITSYAQEEQRHINTQLLPVAKRPSPSATTDRSHETIESELGGLPVGDRATIEFTVSNDGGAGLSAEGYLSISHAETLDVVGIEQTAGDTEEDFRRIDTTPGERFATSTGNGTAESPLVDIVESYDRGESNTYAVTVEREASGDAWLTYRSALETVVTGDGETAFERAPTDVETVDQQGWPAYRLAVEQDGGSDEGGDSGGGDDGSGGDEGGDGDDDRAINADAALSFEQGTVGEPPATPWSIVTDQTPAGFDAVEISETHATDGSQTLHVTGNGELDRILVGVDANLSDVATVRADVYLERANVGWGEIWFGRWVDGESRKAIGFLGQTGEGPGRFDATGEFTDLEGDVSDLSGEHELVFNVRGDNEAYFDDLQFLDADGDVIPPGQVVVGADTGNGSEGTDGDGGGDGSGNGSQSLPAQNAVAVHDDTAYLVSSGEILEVDLATRSVVDRFQAPGGTDRGLAYGAGSLWYADAATDPFDGRILELDPETGAVRSTIDTGYDPYGLAFGDGSLWAGEVTGVPNNVYEFSPDGRQLGSFDIGGPAGSTGPNGLAYANGSVWVGTGSALFELGPDGGVVQRISDHDAGYKGLAGTTTTLYGPDRDGELSVLRTFDDSDGGGGSGDRLAVPFTEQFEDGLGDWTVDQRYRTSDEFVSRFGPATAGEGGYSEEHGGSVRLRVDGGPSTIGVARDVSGLGAGTNVSVTYRASAGSPQPGKVAVALYAPDGDDEAETIVARNDGNVESGTHTITGSLDREYPDGTELRVLADVWPGQFTIHVTEVAVDTGGGDDSVTPGDSPGLALRPTDPSVNTSETTSLGVVLTNASAGVGSYDDITVSVADPEIATVTAIDDQTGADEPSRTVAPGGSSATISASNDAEITNPGPTPIASVTLRGEAAGTTALGLETTGAIRDDAGDRYALRETRDTDLTVEANETADGAGTGVEVTTSGTATVPPGGETTVTFTVTNTGSETATSGGLQVSTPGALSITDVSGDGAGQPGRFVTSPIEPGETMTVTYTFAADAGAPPGTVTVDLTGSLGTDRQATTSVNVTIQQTAPPETPLDVVQQDGNTGFREVLGVIQGFNADGTYAQDGQTVDVGFQDVLEVIQEFNSQG